MFSILFTVIHGKIIGKLSQITNYYSVLKHDRKRKRSIIEQYQVIMQMVNIQQISHNVFAILSKSSSATKQKKFTYC